MHKSSVPRRDLLSPSRDSDSFELRKCRLPADSALRTLVVLLALLLPGLSASRLLCGQLQQRQLPVAESIKATNVVVLREKVGQRVTVHGRVGSTGKSRSGHNFLNMLNSELSVICFREDVGKFKDGPPADTYRNKDVQIAGTLQLYRNKLQIKLSEPGQIQILSRSTDAGSPKTQAAELQQIGRLAWKSPAGLTYRGLDPSGLTRVEHIMRHAHDLPGRTGPHGVFDADEPAEVFSLIDEAWQLARQRGLEPRVEGDRSTYLVDMGRRVGFLGGQTGRSRRHPELRRIFIVFETNTNNIVTAYPR